MFVVTLREGIEAFLIVAITASYIRKTGRNALLPPVWWGAGAAVLLSFVLGAFLAEFAVTPLWEGMLAAAAGVLVITMVAYMVRAARNLGADIAGKVDDAVQQPGYGAWIGVFLFVVLMVTREGMEMALIGATLVRQSGSSQLLAGATLGIAAAAALAWAWSRLGHRLNLSLFFQATSIFLLIFAAQLLLHSFYELTEAAVLPINNQYWHEATREWVKGTNGRLITGCLVVLPLAWLAVAHLRGQKIIQAA